MTTTEENVTPKKPTEMLLVQSKVKEFFREADLMCSSDLVDELNARVVSLLERAVERARENKRKTARGCDV